MKELQELVIQKSEGTFQVEETIVLYILLGALQLLSVHQPKSQHHTTQVAPKSHTPNVMPVIHCCITTTLDIRGLK